MTGLSTQQVARSRAPRGHNVLTLPERAPWRKEFLSKSQDRVIRALLIAAVVSFGAGALGHQFSFESIGIVAAISLAAEVGYQLPFMGEK